MPGGRRADDSPVISLRRILALPVLWPAALGVYTLTLAVATHWPRLQIHGPVPRSDLWLHVGAFGTLGGLVAIAQFFGPLSSRRNLLLSWAVALGYAALDEATQAIPILGRTAALDDFAADALGVTLGVAAAGVVGWLAARGVPPQGSENPRQPGVPVHPVPQTASEQ